jgi:hypothetical protein
VGVTPFAVVASFETCCAGALPASAYPEAIPRTAVAESPVTRIFAAVAGFLFVRLVFVGLLVGLLDGGGGGGRSGSFSISRHPLLLRGRHHVLRALHGRRHHRVVVVEEQIRRKACLR